MWVNNIVLSLTKTYPTDGTYGFYWGTLSDNPSWAGNISDIVLNDVVLFKGAEVCYCCGMTFEIWWKAMQIIGKASFSSEHLIRIKKKFFGDDIAHENTLVQYALVSERLGVKISNLQDAITGDFLQFWRNNGSGHQVIFLKWETSQGEIVGIHYWSTQTSTNGIGNHFENIGPLAIKRDQIYIVRASGCTIDDLSNVEWVIIGKEIETVIPIICIIVVHIIIVGVSK